MTKKRKPHVVPRMSEDDLKDFVRDYLAGLITTSENVPQNLMLSVFMPLGLGAIQGWTKEETSQIGAVWGHVGKDKTIPGRAINGYPMFVSCRLMRKEDWAIVAATINREREQRTDIKLEKEA